MKIKITPKLDPSDMLFIGVSDVSGATLLPVKLIGSENYGFGVNQCELHFRRRKNMDLQLEHVVRIHIERT